MSSEISKTRKKILDSASRLLLDGKGKDVRMADIAKASGVSRQAVYLHFASRTDLMIATVRYLDSLYGLDERLRRFREAVTGLEILDAFIEFWGNYLPQIYGVAKALMDARGSDKAAAAAWNDRMTSIRNGCRRTIETIEHEGLISSEWTKDEAVDLFWTLMSVENWERLTAECGWPIEKYVERMQTVVRSVLIQEV